MFGMEAALCFGGAQLAFAGGGGGQTVISHAAPRKSAGDHTEKIKVQ